MSKKNCWEFKKCGREKGGVKSIELGICPASSEERVNGMNEGTNGGRICWVLAGTLCKGEIQGTFALKLENCLKCDFYKQVSEEDGRQYQNTNKVLDLLKD